MITKKKSTSKNHIKNVLNQMKDIKKCQYVFILNILMLFMSIKGKINFLQLLKYSDNCEQYFRKQFSKYFDFMKFNRELILQNAGKHLTIAFDPCFISKSGKKTPGLGYFWSGCAGQAKRGLEISGIAAVDIDNHTAFHLQAVQTPTQMDNDNLLIHYAKVISDRKDELRKISEYVVADAYFSKKSFVDSMLENEFHIVSRLRNDANLRYKYTGEQKSGRGRPKQFDGKVKYELESLEKNRFKTIIENEKQIIYSAIVNSVALKRDINLIIVYSKTKNKWNHKLYFSTDLAIEPILIFKYYKARFQIEFIYRDAKQYTGLNDCQARCKSKLNFHFNISLTAINIAKVSYWLSLPIKTRGAFSMADVKTRYYNDLQLKRFLASFGINTNLKKNINKIRQLREFGTIAS